MQRHSTPSSSTQALKDDGSPCTPSRTYPSSAETDLEVIRQAALQFSWLTKSINQLTLSCPDAEIWYELDSSARSAIVFDKNGMSLEL